MNVTAPPEPPAEAVPAVVYGSWGRRVAAFGLDYLIVIAPFVIVLTRLPSSDTFEGLMLVFGWPAIILLFVGYFVGFHGGKRGQTLGKRILGIAVRDAETFLRIGYARALGRLLVTVLLWSFFWIPGIVDSLRPLWDGRKQAFHDKFVGTVVIKV